MLETCLSSPLGRFEPKPWHAHEKRVTPTRRYSGSSIVQNVRSVCVRARLPCLPFICFAVPVYQSHPGRQQPGKQLMQREEQSVIDQNQTWNHISWNALSAETGHELQLRWMRWKLGWDIGGRSIHCETIVLTCILSTIVACINAED